MSIRLDRSKIEWVAQNRYPLSTDIELFESGFRSAIRNSLNRSQLLAIGEWKSIRVRSRLASNSDESIEAFTEAAFRATNPLVAAWALQYLSGVKVRMASAILTVHDPETYTVYDVRAMSTLQALDYGELGIARPEWLEERHVLDSTRRYADYLELCRVIAAKHGVTLRTLDRCLWAMNGEDVVPC